MQLFILSPLEGVELMNTYEEFMVILTMALLVVSILNLQKK